jgi:hypothetical protein
MKLLRASNRVNPLDVNPGSHEIRILGKFFECPGRQCCPMAMKKNFLRMAGAAALALGLGACAYDPYYTGNTRTAVSVGYGDGYGYGGSAFSTSYFWSTGNSGWGYDPYVRCYYHYGRRAYYDPYLYGYYPVGYRPRPLVGVPHPHGYRQGWCPPPSRVTNVTVGNYRDRESAYRNMNHDWARRVKYDSRSQGVPAAPTRSREESNRRGNSNPFFGGYINNGENRGGSNNREVQNNRGSGFQPRGTTFGQPMPSGRPAPTRPTFGSMPDVTRGTPEVDRGRNRVEATPRMERAPRQIETPAPRPEARSGGGESRRHDRGEEGRAKSR